MISITRLLALALGCLVSAASVAQTDFPRKPIQVVVPYGPGGAVDVAMRIVTDHMAQTLGQALVVLNRPGGNANIGPGVVLQSPPDGYTLLASSTATVVNPLADTRIGWNRDSFSPVARMATSPSLFVVPASSGIKTLAEFVARAKAKPGELTTPVTGPGSSQAVARESFARLAGIQLLDVAYKGGTSFMSDLIGGRLSMSVSPLNVVLPMVKEGQLVALVNTGDQRSPLVPDVPTLAELGFGEAASNSWFGLHAPAGTPAPVIAKLAAAVAAAMQDPKVRSQFVAAGAEPAFLDTAGFNAFIDQETVKAKRYVATLPASK
jgi:tripartite-type tricarboxylate transporter receptor subunit TctC